MQNTKFQKYYNVLKEYAKEKAMLNQLDHSAQVQAQNPAPL
jgi:hypothetical protein